MIRITIWIRIKIRIRISIRIRIRIRTMKPELSFISFEKWVDCDDLLKHHYRREGGAGWETNILQ